MEALFKTTNKIGFTLAEVLVTLAVIGIVAALTIPSLLKDYQEKQWKSAWKKTYSDLSQAHRMIVADHGGSLAEYYIGVDDQAAPLVEKFSNKMSVVLECLPDPGSGWTYNKLCTDNSVSISTIEYKTMDGGNVFNWYNLYHGQLVLKNGVHLFLRMNNQYASIILADVNGYNKGPNTLGKDMFGAIINKDWMKPMGAEGTGTTIDTCSTTAVTCSGNDGFHHGSSCAGVGCSSYVILNKDY